MWVVLILLLIAAAFALSLGVAQMAVWGLIPSLPPANDLGEAASMYGAAGTIISGLVIFASLALQARQLKRQQADLTKQQSELQEQKSLLDKQVKALTETSRSQRDAADNLRDQLFHMLARTSLDDYDRRLGRFIDAQAHLHQRHRDLDFGLDSPIPRDEARDLLGPRYLTTLTNLLRGLDRLCGVQNLDPPPGELVRELRTSLQHEQNLLYLAVVPTRVPDHHYKPSELGRLMAAMALFPFVRWNELPPGRAAVFRDHFYPLISVRSAT